MPQIDITNEPLELTVNGTPVAEFRWQGTPGHRINLILYDGEITNVRNIQGGTNDDPHLDISAGGPPGTRGHRGEQWDNGGDWLLGNGRKEINLESRGHDTRASDFIRAHVPLRLDKGLFIPNGSGGWTRVRL